ncbi:MAG TPA: cytochrome c oxidase subunit 3, partial [Gammaproteobacteria bacterium]|nr:cytochrome c oxidase subunit 3 [Gammaproteobacteria bacterium]
MTENMDTVSNHYYVPHGTRWPILGSIGLFLTVFGTALWFNEIHFGTYVALVGVIVVAIMLFGWFGTVILESEHGMFNEKVDKSFRYGMTWFIFTEVMFFGAFFGALFYARELSVPWLAGAGSNFFTNLLLWQGFQNSWPSAGPAAAAAVQAMPAWGIPALNTAILLSSGVTITIAHHMLRSSRRIGVIIFLAATFLLGFLFLGMQAHEYIHAYTEMNLRLDTGIYGTTFFMLTGFHG